MSLRSPLSRVLNHGTARSGVSHWRSQRVTATALVPLSAWVVISLLALPTRNYALVSAWIASGLHPVLLALTILLAAWHAWLGLAVVIEDYVHGFGTKTCSLLLSTFVHGLLAASALYAVLRIALRGPA